MIRKCQTCSYQTPAIGNLRNHYKYVHDIGNRICSNCETKCNSHISHSNKMLCRVCFEKATGCSSRVEYIMKMYIRTHFGTLSRKDKKIIVHCDIMQNKYNTSDVSTLSTVSTVSDIPVVIIHWNPSHFTSSYRVKQADRLEELVKLLKKIRMSRSKLSETHYMFYG